jgi:hypothetical protein
VKTVPWQPQTAEAWDPLAVRLQIEITINGITREVEGTFDTGADMTELQPPLITEFAIDEDQSGFATASDAKGRPDTQSVVMASARFDDKVFDMPVCMPRRATRAVNVFGRAGLMDHFRIVFDPDKSETTFEARDLSPKSRIGAIKQSFIDDRVGTRQRFIQPKLPFVHHGPGKRRKRP